MNWLCPKCRGAFTDRRERCPTDGTRVVRNFSGKIFARRFVIERLLGAGTTGGTVWSGVAIETQRPIALKLVASTDLAEVRRFERGARISGMLQNPHIAAVIEHGRDGEYNFLAMELLDGETLHRRFARQRVASPAEAVHIADQVLEALGYAHAHGIVHRDIKLSNLFVCPTAGDPLFVKVLDFGIAKWVAGEFGEGEERSLTDDDAPLDADETLAVTQAQQILGTPEYMAPEQIVGGAADVRSDLYALGIVLFRLLAGAHPFPAKTRVEMYQAHLGGVLPAGLEGVPPAVYAVVKRALAKRPEDRWENAATMRRALVQALASASATVAPLGPMNDALVMEATPGPVLVMPALVRPTPKRRGTMWLAIAIALLLGAGVGALVLSGVFGSGEPSAVAAGASPVGVTAEVEAAPRVAAQAQAVVAAAPAPTEPVAANTAADAGAAPEVAVAAIVAADPAPADVAAAAPVGKIALAPMVVPVPMPVAAAKPIAATAPGKPTASPAAPTLAPAAAAKPVATPTSSAPAPTPAQTTPAPTPAPAQTAATTLPSPMVPVVVAPPSAQQPAAPVDDDTPRVLPAGAAPPRALAGLGVTPADYPRTALASRLEGTVIAKVIVHIDGHVELVKFIQADPNFTDAVLGILKRLRYAPVVFEGRRIAVYQNLKFPFTID